MSTLLEQASLVMIPSGYKEDVVYSQIPTNGNGDLTFTRASNGTRVNSAGLVEEVPWNLFEYSEQFDNAYWGKDGGVSVSANSTIAPNGTTTAETISYNGTPNIALYKTSISGLIGAYTISFYIKAPSGQENKTINFRMFNSQVNQNITLTSEWVRYQFTATATGNNNCEWGVKNSATATSIYLWGAQLNIGSTAKPYFPTTDRLNVPRLTYQNGGGGCPALLLEPQRTNLALQSEDFSSASWIKNASSVTANTTTSPDGTTNADTITSTATSLTLVVQTPTIVSGTTYSTTFYAKQNTQRFIYIRFTSNAVADNYVSVVFDLQDGTVGQTSVGTTSGTLVSATATSSANGFYRITVIASINRTDGNIGIGFASAKTGNTFSTSGSVTSSVTNGNSLFLWGAQVEASSYPTSYIPTTSSSATRVADVCKTSGLSAVLPQTAGTLFWDIEYTSGTTSTMLMHNTGVSDYGFVQVGSNGIVEGGIYESGTMVDRLAKATAITTGRHKIAFAYETNSFALYVDGSLADSGTSGSTASISMNTLSLNWNSTTDFTKVNEAVLFPTRLTNAELASLTTI